MNKIIAACIVTCLFSACANKEPDHDSSLGTADSLKATPVMTNNDSLANNPGASVLPGTLQPGSMVQPATMIQPGTMTQSQQVVSQAVTAAAPGMNPAHGQPGHRCDIAVGAPLNSAPTKPATVTTPVTTTATSPVTTTAVPTPAKTVTAPGMNPPHGEPNHRCDIAVGAPLNSPVTKPATQTVQPTVTPTLTPAVAPVITPAKKDSGR